VTKHPSVIAVVPARGGSKGLPGKNIKMLGNRPLLSWPIHTAKESAYIQRVILSTDETTFAEIGRQAGAEAPFIRPSELASDTANSIDVVTHALGFLAEKFDYIVLLEPTSPLTSASLLDSAIQALIDNRQHADACVGVVQEINAHPNFLFEQQENELLRPFLDHEMGVGIRRQDVSKVFRPEGSFYISDIEALKENQSFYHKRTMGYEVPDWMSYEIDNPLDFTIIEAIARYKGLIE